MLAAGGELSSAPENPARNALQILCQSYWYPLYAYVRHRGHGPDDARDLTQSFFLHLLEKNKLALANPDRGRFRSFLLGALKNFLANDWHRASAQKRNAARNSLPLSPDFDAAEIRYRRESSDNATPERLYERRWALTLLDAVLIDLQSEYAAGGRAKLFEHLKSYLTGDDSAPSHAQTAADLCLSEGAVQVTIHRLRKKYRELLRAHITRTVESPIQVDDEIRDLFLALRA